MTHEFVADLYAIGEDESGSTRMEQIPVFECDRCFVLIRDWAEHIKCAHPDFDSEEADDDGDERTIGGADCS